MFHKIGFVFGFTLLLLGIQLGWERRTDSTVWWLARTVGSGSARTLELLSYPDLQVRHQLLEADGLSNLYWSPDGQAVTFRAWGDLFLLHLNGQRLEQITAAPELELPLDWNTYYIAKPPDVYIYRYHPEAQTTELIYEGELTKWTPPTHTETSPDGQAVVYSVQSGAIVKKDNLTEQVLVSGGDSCDYPAWSPDGAWIAFACRFGDGAFGNDLYRIRADGTGLERLTSGNMGLFLSVEWVGDAIFAWIVRRSEAAPHLIRLDVESGEMEVFPITMTDFALSPYPIDYAMHWLLLVGMGVISMKGHFI